MPHRIAAVQNQVAEWSYTAAEALQDPFNEVDLDVRIRAAGGAAWRVPAYWSGGLEWRVRFASAEPGLYTVETVCANPKAASLHGVQSVLEVAAAAGDAAPGRAVALRVSASRRTLERVDGRPFFWLGDTWWMGLCARLSWPDDFQLLTADRAGKGFNVVQIVAGLYPDMPGFDPRGANEAGFPWEADYARINPAYFDMADLRIRWLVRAGLLPCIVGCWGYYLPLLTAARMRQHWRYLVARWSAYPVVWCLAGEAAMPYYLSTSKEDDKTAQMAGWTELAAYVRSIDPSGHPVTIHPTQIGRDQVNDDALLDIDMLQTGHGGHESVGNTVARVRAERDRQPPMPVLVGEVSYEGIMHGTQAEVQRWTFWAAVLAGAAGFTYGANGIWQVNTRCRPFGPSPHGGTWGNTPWEDAHRLPGSTHLGLARRLLERYAWWEFEPHPDWVDPAGGPENPKAPYAAGIPRQVRIIYVYGPLAPWSKQAVRVTGLEEGVAYTAQFWDPRTGEDHPLGAVSADAEGAWKVPMPPTFDDWVLVLEGAAARPGLALGKSLAPAGVAVPRAAERP